MESCTINDSHLRSFSSVHLDFESIETLKTLKFPISFFKKDVALTLP